MTSNIAITEGTGNVFAALGFPNPEEHQTKASLVHQIAVIIEREGLTQAEAAAKLGIDQSRVSKMLRGHFRGFSVSLIMRFRAALERAADPCSEG
ncbi:MAG: helix-turn-helix DNA-binding protein [Rhodospirillales bacterium]|nr:helix-turn-helix DNA-binding protein [Rhodospirillales bacterium]